MELYKFISENEIKKYKGGFVVVDNRIYTNPTEETVRKAGYKELVDAPCPEYDEATQYIETKYVDDADHITAVFTVHQVEGESEVI